MKMRLLAIMHGSVSDGDYEDDFPLLSQIKRTECKCIYQGKYINFIINHHQVFDWEFDSVRNFSSNYLTQGGGGCGWMAEHDMKRIFLMCENTK